MITKSPGFSIESVAAQRPSVMNVRLLRPPIATFTTFTAAGSTYFPNSSPQPRCPGVPHFTVESPTRKSVGRSGFAGRASLKRAASSTGRSSSGAAPAGSAASTRAANSG